MDATENRKHASMTTPRVSIVIPTYNHLQYLGNAVATALDQTFDSFEVIVVNDGSTDDTRKWLDTQHNPKLRVIHQENKGPAEAINTGVKASAGEYITWMSADNYCASYFIEAFVAALDSDPDSAMAYSPYYVMDADDQIYSIYFANVIALRELATRTGHNRGNASFMYRRSIHDTIGMYKGWTCDQDMWVKILERYNSVYLVEPVYYYRIHKEMATQTKQKEIGAESSEILNEFLKRNNGGINDKLIARLYPSVKNKPGLIPAAISDFSIRMFHAGKINEALSYLKVTLSMYGIDDLMRPLMNFISLSKLANIDPLPHIEESFAANKNLTQIMRTSIVTVAQGIVALNQFKTKPDLYTIEHESMPLKNDMGKIFSFTAWKNGQLNPPLSNLAL